MRSYYGSLTSHINFSNFCPREFLLWKYSICWKNPCTIIISINLLSYLRKTMLTIWKYFEDGKWYTWLLKWLSIWLGLVDAASEKIFDTTLRSLKARWNLLEKENVSANATGFGFYKWFSEWWVIIQTLCTNQINSLNLWNLDPKNTYKEEFWVIIILFSYIFFPRYCNLKRCSH